MAAVFSDSKRDKDPSLIGSLGMKAIQKLVLILIIAAVLLQCFPSRAQPVTGVTAGNIHSLFLKSDGSLWAMGGEGDGQLGDGSYRRTNSFGALAFTNPIALAINHFWRNCSAP
jgi:alpha-tubulin suppressor-like RCC1 family protein